MNKVDLEEITAGHLFISFSSVNEVVEDFSSDCFSFAFFFCSPFQIFN